MRISEIVEVRNVWPSPFGGAMFKCVKAGGSRLFLCKAGYNVLARIPKESEFWKITGDMTYTQENGVVCNVISAVVTGLPSDKYVGGLLKTHDAFRGFDFGLKKIDRLLDATADSDLVDMLNSGDWQSISNTGLSEKISKRVCEEWGKLKEERDLATFLHDHQLDSSLASKVIKMCSRNPMERLKNNPFSLLALSNATIRNLQDIAGIASRLGIDENDDRTLVGLVEFALYEALEDGSTIVEVDALRARISELSKLVGTTLPPDAAICAALKIKAVCVFTEDGKYFIQLIGVAYIEQSVEKKLSWLQKQPMQLRLKELSGGTLTEKVSAYNKRLRNSEGYSLTNQQCDAVEMALSNRLSLLSGFGGTGKTTVLKAIVELAEEFEIPVHVCALAGKAADRARQSINRETFTIHGLIYEIIKSNGKVNKGSDPLIIIDESSMVDISLVRKFLSSFGDSPFKVLLVGDTAQLAPIGFGLFWHEMVKSDVPKVHLTKVHRQLAGSPLHNAAMHIREGQIHALEKYSGQEEGIYLLGSIGDPRVAIRDLMREVDAVTLTSYSSDRIAGSSSQLNAYLQGELNSKRGVSMGLATIALKTGDPVIATINNQALGIYNGMAGFVKSIVIDGDGTMGCNIKFDDRSSEILLSRDECFEVGLDLGYAITIHKSQGSEYESCIVCLSKNLERSAIYTAVTRTKKLCIIVGTQQQYNDAVRGEPRYEQIQCGFRCAA
ncbi:MAG: AAA family ATPase [Desulfuromonadales bacterium]|nr:AAA family ATPase [Desulfuromonadales bacterium]MDW7756157.1 AAA family ATPase [Desulfuromonadales bacterium]